MTNTETTEFDDNFVDHCVNDAAGPVAITLRQKLLPVEGADAVIFPPTYASREKNADSVYNIDTLSDGTKVATIDSVGSQANRVEPIFSREPYTGLVPQITITYGNQKSVSILDVGHRLGDAFIRSTKLADTAKKAFMSFQDSGSVEKIAKLAPTSLVFGVWDSRETMAKLPRIVQSVIRAWNIDPLTRSAQYNPPVDYAELEVFSKEQKQKQEGDTGSQLAKRGFVHIPATGKIGGIMVYGEIRRDVTINLIALRRLQGDDETQLRRYIFGLTLVAATAPLDGFLRQGCLVTPDPETPATWMTVGRDGQHTPIALDENIALRLAKSWADTFEVGPDQMVVFDKDRAKEDSEKKKT